MVSDTKQYTILYGYVNSFDKFITLQAYYRQTQAKANTILQEWSTQIEKGAHSNYVTNLHVNVHPETFVIESPLYLTFKTIDTSYRSFEIWIIPSNKDIFGYIERTPSADNMPDLPMSLIPLFGLPLSSLKPATGQKRFTLTGSPHSTAIKKL